MRALVWHGPERMSVDALPDPQPAPARCCSRPPIVDYVSRLVADVLLVGKLYPAVVWA